MTTRGRVASTLAVVGVSLAAAVSPTWAGSLAPRVALVANTPVTAGKPMTFTATSTVVGGRLALELRGIDLTRASRATYARPDYRDKRRCTAVPCRWTVTANAPTTFEFRAFLVNVRNGKISAQSPGLRAVWLPAASASASASAAPAKPTGLKLTFGGKSFPLEPLVGGADNYRDIAAGNLNVEAHWTGDPRGTGYRVVISTTEPSQYDWATCTSGTSCVVSKARIDVNQEMSWIVRVLKGGKVVSGVRVCLVGRA